MSGPDRVVDLQHVEIKKFPTTCATSVPFGPDHMQSPSLRAESPLKSSAGRDVDAGLWGRPSVRKETYGRTADGRDEQLDRRHDWVMRLPTITKALAMTTLHAYSKRAKAPQSGH